MKASRTLKKPILLAMAAILTVAVIASVAVTFAFADGANNATLEGYQVAMNGNVSLRFYYKDIQNVSLFKAQVEGAAESVTYAISENETKVMIEVPLAPSEMAKKVTVWPVFADESEGEKVTYSVAQYGSDVIDTTEDDDIVRALLNWGNHANVKFGESNGQIADVFARNSNPIDAVTSVGYEELAAAEGYGEIFIQNGSSANLALEANNIKLNFYVKYNGEEALTATISRDTVEGKNNALVDEPVSITKVSEAEDGDTYLVSIGRVSINLFDKAYTLKVTDGTNNFKAQISVLKYLDQLISANEDADAVNTAKALYQFYQLGTNDLPADCKHTVDAYYCENDASSDALKCSTCFASLGVVNDSVNYFNHASNIDKPYNAAREYLYDSEAGIAYTRITTNGSQAYISLTQGNGGYGLTASEKSTPGKYLVLYHRINNTVNYEKFHLVAGHSTEVNANLQPNTSQRGYLGGSEARYNSLIKKVTDWQMTVIDLNQSTHTGYTYPIGAEEEYSLFFQLTTTGAGELSIDIAYAAVVDDVNELIGLPYAGAVNNKYHAISNFVSGDATAALIPGAPCDNHVPSTTSAKNGTDTVYTTVCTVCGYTMAIQTVGENVNYFNHGVNIDEKYNSGVTAECMIDDAANIPYTRFTAAPNKIIPLTQSSSDVKFTAGGYNLNSGALSTAEKYKPGRYLVMYHRVDPSVASTVGKFFLWAGHSDTVSSAMNTTATRGTNPEGARYNSVIKVVTDWQMTVIDLTEWNYNGSGYPENSDTEYSLFFALQTNNGQVIIDIAYIAMVDSLDELASLPGADAVNNNYNLITKFISDAGVETPIPNTEE